MEELRKYFMEALELDPHGLAEWAADPESGKKAREYLYMVRRERKIQELRKRLTNGDSKPAG